jgi:hypothetical protein
MTSSAKKLIIKELDHIPDQYLDEVLSFFNYIRFKSAKAYKIHDNAMLTAFVSEGALMKEWLKPEENEAWKEL